MDGRRQYRTVVGVPTKDSTRRARSLIPFSLRPSFPHAVPPVSLPPLFSPSSLPKYPWFTRHPISGYPHLQIPRKEFLEHKRLVHQKRKIKSFIKAERKVPREKVRQWILTDYLQEYQIPTKKKGFTNRKLQKDLLKPWFKEDHRWLMHQVKHARYIRGQIDDPEQWKTMEGRHESRLGAPGLRASSSMWKQWCFYRKFLAHQRARPGYKGLDAMTITYKLPWEDRHCCWPYIKERHGWPWACLLPQGPYTWAPYWWQFRQFGDVPQYCAKKPTRPPESLVGNQIGPTESKGGPGFDVPGCDYAETCEDKHHCN
ncbi:hypothetical protein R1flu_013036 [Riccia fluitans]|uniref:Uncharacterized protein n=1 Tax=Riccia fluitans TaxID=41844 RepID=A0ABD1ZCB0_9MARC